MVKQISHIPPLAPEYPFCDDAWMRVARHPEGFFGMGVQRKLYEGIFPQVQPGEVLLEFLQPGWIPNFFGRGKYWFCAADVAKRIEANLANNIDIISVEAKILEEGTALDFYLLKFNSFVRALSSDSLSEYSCRSGNEDSIYGRLKSEKRDKNLKLVKSKIEGRDLWLDPTVLGPDMLFSSDEFLELLNSPAEQCLRIMDCDEV